MTVLDPGRIWNENVLDWRIWRCLLSVGQRTKTRMGKKAKAKQRARNESTEPEQKVDDEKKIGCVSPAGCLVGK